MPITTVWGAGNTNLVLPGDPAFDPNNDLQNGYQSSCGGAANPYPLDFYLNEVGLCLQNLEAQIGAGGGGGVAVNLNDLTDATTAGAAAGNALLFNDATNIWEPGAVLTSATSVASSFGILASNIGGALTFRGVLSETAILEVSVNGNDVLLDFNSTALIADAGFTAALDAAIAARIDPSDITRVGGVYTQHAQTGSGTVSVSLPVGGQWRYIFTGGTHGGGHPRIFNPGFYSVSGGWDNDEEEFWTMAGQSAGGSTWSFSESEPMTLSLFAVRIS